MTQQQLQTRLAQAEAETNRLRQCVSFFSLPPLPGHSPITLYCSVNEALMLGTAEQRHAAAASAVAAAQGSSTNF